MLHILTDEELEDLVPARDLHDATVAIKLLGEKLLDAKDLHCIHEPGKWRSYCDDCPLSGLGVLKQKRQDGPNALGEEELLAASRLFCRKSKNFSK
jgi:hypothetical protein